ncbi:MAG: hypothetical protein HY815_07345 [Candidatus Riflebacteria bacterium]|nr:hypothetical protein [Candidatus Riflebacteria bacterium]
MNLGAHVLVGGVASAGLYPWLGAEGAAVFLGASVLIDVDHYWHWIEHNRFTDFGPSRMFDYHHRLSELMYRPGFLAICPFHTVEFFILVHLLATILDAPLLDIALCGFLFHLTFDLIHLASHRVIFKRALSIVEYWVRRRMLIASGQDPEAIVDLAVEQTAKTVPRRAVVEGPALTDPTI